MDNSPATWERIESKQIADCRVFRVREDVSRRSDGVTGSFFVLENSDWVNIIAVTKDGDVVMIEQFRHGMESVILEIPGGMVDENESPENAAKRELLEETGYSSQNWVLLGKSYPNPAVQNNSLYHYLALDCEKNSEVSFDEHENIISRLMPLADIYSAITTGKITHSLVVAAFFYLAQKSHDGRK
jgi:NTP pyrophosphohydrolases including oxidative damage repair enzymes